MKRNRIIRGAKKESIDTIYPTNLWEYKVSSPPFLFPLLLVLFSSLFLVLFLPTFKNPRHSRGHRFPSFEFLEKRGPFRRISLKLEIRLFIQTKVWKGRKGGGGCRTRRGKFLHGRVVRTISPLTGKLFFLARQASYCERQF